MKFPEKVKIGGLTYTVEVAEKLDFGTVNCSAEILYNDLIIRITPQKKRKNGSRFVA